MLKQQPIKSRRYKTRYISENNRFPIGTYDKLNEKKRAIGHCRFMNWVTENAYIVKTSLDLNISNVLFTSAYPLTSGQEIILLVDKFFSRRGIDVG